tara:strand:- start:147 stop:611 length:465 start_codon:yes stop_codon:yes gene_type:complete
MKVRAFFLLLPALVSCSYATKQDAKAACELWKAKKHFVVIASYRDEQPLQSVNRNNELKRVLLDLQREDLSSYRDADQFREQSRAFQFKFFEQLELEDESSREIVQHRVAARWCFDDLSRPQFIGYENKAVLNGQWVNQQGMKGSGEAVKYFRY